MIGLRAFRGMGLILAARPCQIAFCRCSIEFDISSFSCHFPSWPDQKRTRASSRQGWPWKTERRICLNFWTGDEEGPTGKIRDKLARPQKLFRSLLLLFWCHFAGFAKKKIHFSYICKQRFMKRSWRYYTFRAAACCRWKKKWNTAPISQGSSTPHQDTYSIKVLNKARCLYFV